MARERNNHSLLDGVAVNTDLTYLDREQTICFPSMRLVMFPSLSLGNLHNLNFVPRVEDF